MNCSQVLDYYRLWPELYVIVLKHDSQTELILKTVVLVMTSLTSLTSLFILQPEDHRPM